jgi:hypothetical protein
VSIEYRIIVIGQNNAAKGTITAAEAIFSIDEYSIAPDGNCLEATFRLPPKKLSFSILPRDVVRIETRPNSSASFVPRYLGFVTLAGNPRSDNVETYRCVGLKQRYYELVLSTVGRAAEIASNDVATMATSVREFAFSQSGFPAIAGESGNVLEAPLLSFTAGRRITQLESAGSAFDGLAEQVGRFVVPTSSTYTYDSVTFTAGQVVPPVTWGVRANGQTFFRRTLPMTGAFSETDVDTDVQYPALSGEESITNPVIVYYPGMDLTRVQPLELRNVSAGTNSVIEPVLQPWTFKSIAGNATQRVFQLPNPEPYLVNALSEFTATTNTFGSPTNMFDGDSTSASTGVLNAVVDLSNFAGYILDNAPLALKIDAEFGDQCGMDFRAQYTFTVSGVNYRYTMRYVPEAPNEVTRLTLYFPVLIPVSVLSFVDSVGGFFSFVLLTARVIAGPNGSGGTANVYDFRPFKSRLVADASVATQLAASFQRLPANEVTNVKVFGEREIFTQLDVTPQVGSVIEVPVERIQYSITTAEGVTTTYHAGQAYDGELVSERVVLEGLARRAVRSNG